MANAKRLIDATELKNFFGFMRKMWSASEIMYVINEAETVDAVEVVHGRWVKRIVDISAPYHWRDECSICGFDICGLGDEYLFKYCPNCGAKMDGGNEDG